MLNNYKKDRCYIIAEIGGNFTTYEEAKMLIDLACLTGVDAVKLQTYNADTIVTKTARFDLDNVGNILQRDLFEKYQIDYNMHKQVVAYIESKGLDWFSTPSHYTDVELLEKLNIKAYKIGADDVTNMPLLRYVSKKGKTVILSSGYCTIEEIKEAVNAILSEGNEKIVIFHTVSNYPTYPEQVNLLVIQSLIREFPYFDIGFSDHTIGTTACISAAIMGARVVEKHFTYNKNADGPDHQLSADPSEMKMIVDTIREYEIMKGDGIKRPVGKEVENRIKNRKSIVATSSIKKGDTFSHNNVDIKRPGNGIDPKFYSSILGKKASIDINEDQVLQWGDVL